jgi:tellurite resistance protein
LRIRNDAQTAWHQNKNLKTNGCVSRDIPRKIQTMVPQPMPPSAHQDRGTHPETARLAHFPASYFAVVMGTTGLAIAFLKASQAIPMLKPVGLAILALAATIFLVLAGFYSAKILLHFREVRAEFAHPVRLHFIPAITIALILLSIGLMEMNRMVSEILFLVAVPAHLVLTLVVLGQWLNKGHFQTPHLNPAWFIPIVGNILVPIPGVTLGYPELSWFCFSIGIVFWLPLLTIILNRVLFHQPLPERLVPTLFILIAPPAVGFLAYLKLTSPLDAFARVLYYFAAFLTLFLATQAPRMLRLNFYLSWWAYSFPMAAVTIATFAMHEKTGSAPFLYAGLALLACASVLIAGLMIRTIVAISRREICQPE